MLACVFGRSRKSMSAPGPAFEPSPAHEPADRPAAEHLQEWRDAAKRVARAYHAWCAASRSEQQERYRSFLDALRREEGAAQQVERDASGLGSPDPGC